ncbi:hypothetical protein ACFV10_35415 [Streptomyces cyaneofuscatus]|uniref:hypothetical protein n=1 Tax=Streptomyces cyaneofuscatus TaxID=66883 RepID=UPI00368978E1
MTADLMGIDIAQGGAVALLTVVVLMVLTGRLVPRRTYDDLLKERDTWREAHTVSEAARTSERAQTQELLELSRTSAHALQALPRMGLEEDSEVDAR